MNPIRTSAGASPARVTEMKTVAHSNGVLTMYLLHEALAKVRTRRPQAGHRNTSTEATRPARTIAAQARRRAAREMGTL
jgi:hypothetical protein